MSRTGDDGRYQRLILELATLDKWDHEEALLRIVRLGAETLGVERVSFWTLEREPLAIHCQAAYQSPEVRLTPGLVLPGSEHPRYFAALLEEQAIAAEDAQNDPRTTELIATYLTALGIGAMLDVPVWTQGRLTGVLCHEHVGPPRAWSERDRAFALALAQAITTTLEMRDRRRAEEKLHHAEKEQVRLLALEQAAREQVRIRDEFLSLASHELNSPLTALQLAVQSLRRWQLVGSEAARALSLVERQVGRLSALISSLVDVARIRAGRLELELERFDLAELVQEVCRRYRRSLERAHCALSVCAPEPVVGSWDRRHIERVLTSLLSNALKFASGKPIDVSVGRDRMQARLVVRDQGIGIPPERVGVIFDRFERAVSARSYGGIGLGLYIVRAIVEAHAGTVRLDTTPGRGTTVIIELPA
jgi:signal transduction histidine kinase